MQRSSLTIISLCAIFSLTKLHAADIRVSHRESLEARLSAQGKVPVHIVLVNSTMAKALEQPESFQRQTQEAASKVIAELGANILPGGLRVSPLGAMDAWVNAEGLKALLRNPNVVSVRPGPEWNHKTLVPDIDKSLTTINSTLRKTGSAQVDVFLNVDGAGFDIDPKTGAAELRLSSSEKASAISSAATLFEKLGISLDAPGAKNLAKTVSIVDTSKLETNGRITVVADELGLADLASHESVRAIKPAAYIDSTPRYIDKDATAEISRSGKVGVIVQLRNPFAGGALSPNSVTARGRSNKKMLDEILSSYTTIGRPQIFENSGAAYITLDQANFDRLLKSEDKRFQGILANKPMYAPSLSTSTVSMNVPFHWALGRKGAGQMVAVIDSGVEKDHKMLLQNGVSGASKVIYEGCYQSDTYWNFTDWVSSCIDKNLTGNGDSPFNTPGSGAPISKADCLLVPHDPDFDIVNHGCNHGTHIAGIAAGKSGTVPYNGISPGATIAAFNVLSKGDGLWAFPADIIAIMDQLTGAFNQPGIQPLTLNFSMGRYKQLVPSVYEDGTSTFMANVANLRGKGIATIAAMGNDGYTSGMNEPASVYGVIKVGSVRNDGIGLTVATRSNRAKPTKFPNEYIFFAPGGEDHNVGVTSALAYSLGKDAVTTVAGTSMATPHVAGVYALLKSVFPSASTDVISDYIVDFATQPIYAKACEGYWEESCNYETEFLSIRLPSIQ